MWSLFLTSFFLMFRKLNVSKTYGTECRFLRCEHISIAKDRILVKIFWTKTLQLREKILELPLLKIPSCELCPVKAMINMIRLVPTKSKMALFARTDGSPITYPVYMKFLKSKIYEIGLDGNNFSTHSFHQGVASWAIKNGIPESIVQVMGDWKSDCYTLHINCPCPCPVIDALQRHSPCAKFLTAC